MNRTTTSFLAALALACAALAAPTAQAQAHGTRHGAIAIGHPWARATAPGQPVGGAYLTLDNKGPAGDRLLGASAVAVAERVEIHSMTMEGDVMRMRSLGSIDLPAGRGVALKLGGTHLMLMGLKAPLKAGEKFPLKLRFEKAGEVEVVVNVETAAGAVPAHGTGH